MSLVSCREANPSKCGIGAETARLQLELHHLVSMLQRQTYDLHGLGRYAQVAQEGFARNKLGYASSTGI